MCPMYFSVPTPALLGSRNETNDLYKTDLSHHGASINAGSRACRNAAREPSGLDVLPAFSGQFQRRGHRTQDQLYGDLQLQSLYQSVRRRTGVLRAGNLADGKHTIHYTSDLVATAPTGDTSRGFSTGHPTVDWTNTFSHTFSSVIPYLSIGAANTISDTSFFVRPFSSKGIVGHYEAGTLINVAPRVTIGGSAYGVRATGEQEIISKVVETPVTQPVTAAAQQQSSPGGVLGTVTQITGIGNTQQNSVNNAVPVVFETQQQTIGPAAVANDHGFSTWLSVRPGSSTDFQIGYSRSQTYQLNSLFFGVGFRVGR
jgi:hypothetical protein